MASLTRTRSASSVAGLVGGGLHERIEVRSFAEHPVSVELRLAVGNDFADLFEVKDFVRDRSAEIKRDHAADGSRLVFRYENQPFEAETRVEVSTPADRVDGDDLVWNLELPARGEWSCEIHVPLKLGPREIQAVHRDVGETADPDGTDPVSRWLAQIPKLETDSHLLDRGHGQDRPRPVRAADRGEDGDRGRSSCRRPACRGS